MSKFALPILCFDDDGPIPSRVQWADGTRLAYAGILGSAFDPEWQAEEKRKQQLRDSGVALLEDYK